MLNTVAGIGNTAGSASADSHMAVTPCDASGAWFQCRPAIAFSWTAARSRFQRHDQSSPLAQSSGFDPTNGMAVAIRSW